MNATDKYLHENRAWNWKWPGERNTWPTSAKRRGPSERYHGPSKRTLRKRAAKALRGR